MSPAVIDALSPVIRQITLDIGDDDTLDLGANTFRIDADNPASPGVKTAVDESNRTIVASVARVWRNFVRRGDVNNNGGVQALDALVVLNALRRGTFTVSDDDDTLRPPSDVGLDEMRYVDVNGDGRLSPLDALTVLNDLRRAGLSGGGGGESVGRPMASPGRTFDIGGHTTDDSDEDDRPAWAVDDVMRSWDGGLF